MINIYIGYNMLEDTFYKLFQLNFACNVTNHFFYPFNRLISHLIMGPIRSLKFPK